MPGMAWTDAARRRAHRQHSRRGLLRQPIRAPDTFGQLLIEYLPRVEIGLLELCGRPEWKFALRDESHEAGIVLIG